MKHLVYALVASTMLLVQAPAVAEALVIPDGLAVLPQAVTAFQEKCANSCIIMDQADWEKLRAQVQAMVQSAQIKKGSI